MYIEDYLAISRNHGTTFMDACILAIVRNYDKLHLFNLFQKQLLQAICDDASEADLRAHLDSTLLKITDGANEEEGDFAEFTWKERESGKARPGPESSEMLARGRVYEKALGEARDNTRIEKFLVMELEKDASLTDYLGLNLPKVRRLKVACWAATCNFVHMVMALIHCRGEGDREFLYRALTIAVKFGYVELVKRLTELEEFDVSRGRRIVDFDDFHLREAGKPIQRIVYESDCLYYYAFRDRLTPLNLVAKLGNLEVVNTFLACKRIDGALSPEDYRALHWAAKMEHAEVVNAILLNKDLHAAVLMAVEKLLIVNTLSYGFDTSFDWFDGSDIGRFVKVSFTPLQLASLYSHVSVAELLKERLEATIEYETGVAALQIATETRKDEMAKMLMDIPEVEKNVKRLHRERQSLVNAANAILVVAALVAGVTFASPFQPHSGYSPFFGSANFDVGAPIPPGMYPSLASVENHPMMPLFCIANSLSFVFAIATLVVGAAAARPPRRHKYIGVEVLFLRRLLRSAYVLLISSVTFVMCDLTVFPPIPIYFYIYGSMHIWYNCRCVYRNHACVRNSLMKPRWDVSVGRFLVN
jgi:ankyrin repeat protein